MLNRVISGRKIESGKDSRGRITHCAVPGVGGPRSFFLGLQPQRHSISFAIRSILMTAQNTGLESSRPSNLVCGFRSHTEIKEKSYGRAHPI